MSLHQFLMMAVMCLVIFLLRAFPFLVFRDASRQPPPLLLYLGRVLTAAAIAMLVVYGLAGMCDFSHPRFSRLLWALPATLATILAHWKRRNSLLSILVGTGLYMALLQWRG